MTMVEKAARTLFIRQQTERDGASPEWATRYWDTCANEPHHGDCLHAEHQGQLTCDRCVCDEYRFEVRAAIEAIREPTLEMEIAGTEAWLCEAAMEDRSSANWRAMIDAALADGNITNDT